MGSLRTILLGLLIVSLAVPARAGDWYEFSSPNFQFLTDASEADIRSLARYAERYRSILGRLFPEFRLDPPPHSHIFAFRNWVSFRPYTTEGYDGQGQPIGGYMTSQGTERAHIALNLSSGLSDRSMVHEYTHMVTRLNIANLPVWLGEGLAGMMEHSEIKGNGLALGAMPAESWAMLRASDRFGLDQLMQLGADGSELALGDNTVLFYLESQAFVQYLFLGEGGRHRSSFLLYLQLLGAGEEEGEAWKTAFAAPVKDFEEGFAESLNRLSPEVLRIALPPLPEMELGPMRPIPESVALAHRSELWFNAGKREKAAEVYQELVDAGEAGPEVHYLLGRLAMDEARFIEAEDHFRAGLALSPDALHLRYYTVMAFFRGRLGDLLGQEELRGAMGEVVDLLSPLVEEPRRFPQAYRMMINARVHRGDSPAELIPIVEKAREVMDDSTEFDFLLAHLYVRNQQWREAQHVFRHLAIVATEEVDRLDAEEWLNYLEDTQGLEGGALPESGLGRIPNGARAGESGEPAIEYVLGVLSGVRCSEDGVFLDLHVNTSETEHEEFSLRYPTHHPPLVFDRSGSGQSIGCDAAGFSLAAYYRVEPLGPAKGTVLTLEPYPAASMD